MRAEHLRSVRTIVSHADCPDGIASALILHHALPEAEVIFCEHASAAYRELEPQPGMLFCDIAPPPERHPAFVAAGALVLDHHRSAREVVAAFGERGMFADEKKEPGVSGAVLAYRAWRILAGREDEALRRFAELAGIRDTWQTAHPDWDEACAQAAALYFCGYDELAAEDPPFLGPERLEVGRRLHAQRLELARETAAHKCFRLRPDVVVYNDRDRLLSDVAQQLLDSDPAVQIVAGFHYKVTEDGRMLLVVSLRSRREGVDVAAIAKAQGGGGHRSAAGFSLPVEDDSPNPLAALGRVLSD